MAKWLIFLLVLAFVVFTTSARNIPSDAGVNDQKNFMTFGGVFSGIGNNGLPFGGVGAGIGGDLGGGLGGVGGLGGLGGGVGGAGTGLGGGSGVLPFP
ncbi:hypothetical protein TSUD_336690 [Trifolium subterraneum]|uniref:Glycine-rich protein n=1 Tax=Trifolium subterraneum TaxID=3900 RepID=A0A2Z6LUC4_TRISU|nr:hypothetical protein TSUD_336690 [Trifolium subterraneum]